MNLAGLSLRDLEYLVALAEERHFGRAAERCNVSQPALSSQIRKLEELLAIILFERTSRRVLATAAGEGIVRQARIVLSEAQKLMALAREGQGAAMAGRLALAAIQTLGPYLFPLILRALRDAYPDLALNLSEGRTADIVDGLRDGRLDAALLSPPIDDTGLTISPLFVEPFWLACPPDHPLATKKALRAVDLRGPGLLLLDEGHCLRDQALAVCEAGPGVGRHATSLETLRSMVAAGAGYTLLPRLAVRQAEAGGAGTEDRLVVVRPFSGPAPGRVVALAWRVTDPRAGSFAELAGFLRARMPDGTVVVA